MSDPVDSKNAKPRPAKKAAPARKAAAAKAAPPRKRAAATKKPVKRQPPPFALTKSPAPPLPPRANVQGFSIDRAAPPQPDPGTAINLGPIAGTDSPTAALGAGATDLCEIAPSGQVALAGDTFAGNGAFQGAWSPSLGLHVRPGTLSDLIQFDRSFGGNGTLYADARPPQANSQLPAGTISVYGIDYALIANVNNLEPIDTRLVRIDPDNPHWPTVPGSLRGADWQDGNQTQISGYQAADGWVYIVADGFDRQRPVWLYRVPAEKFTDRNWWHAWGIGDDGDWKWDVAPTPLSDDRYGEISLREIDGKSVLSGFNADTGNIEVRVADDPTQVLNPDNSALTIVATQADVPQNYGGYIVPGSTLDRTIILVSQWNTDLNNPYNVQQFVVNLNR
ncbi:DUF4185 domain-containing protein [Mycobacteroides franklinii]|uniref:DUF4185 domain-containing protein n=1 Tax=Mycobacteroides franklinii TaxID=948102 RepID=A0A4R5P510_9MYCO|nr:DUF4185 domain-containing protein [Mycobacteroides franklinii]TDH17642.1 DUF4185 domain-containing protein [Mycobacteroides franklinii]TDZ43266.1 hypothetical protein CCUG64054_03320 [Mycobacteroides franklinii]TDZ50401.1 hypothetical protein CCUG63697_01906 [Mycobacteroides franklinii]TDZ56821.1 hypothetical protein CCUG63696_03322 [Mycobacteroides franklinii]TDZ63762.1 hypothetical protein CCUG63695_03247 [Mycobacteroides franklinii]